MKDLGNRIRLERKALGLTLQNFAELVGTSSSMLQRVETGAKSDFQYAGWSLASKPVIDARVSKINLISLG